MKDDEKSARKEIGDCSSRERCFVVTPIGSEGDPIRRHIDGVIKAAIKPVLEADGYQVIAAHTMSESGTIDKQIFKELYEDKLVIANLTQNNPNVMYEQAARHCFGKPVIIIAEEGSVLPFDILRERTIFYINDAQGILDLRERLQRAVESIKFTKASSPIHDIIHSIKKDAKFMRTLKVGTYLEMMERQIVRLCGTFWRNWMNWIEKSSGVHSAKAKQNVMWCIIGIFVNCLQHFLKERNR